MGIPPPQPVYQAANGTDRRDLFVSLAVSCVSGWLGMAYCENFEIREVDTVKRDTKECR